MKVKQLGFLLLLISSCGPTYTPEEEIRLKNEIIRLSGERNKIRNEYWSLQDQSRVLNNQLREYEVKKKIYEDGKIPVYVLTLHFQETKMEFSLDRISFSFDVPVDEQFYKESEVGTRLGYGSRSFSLFHGGDVTIKDKKIIYR
jgi:hypothetical protein